MRQFWICAAIVSFFANDAAALSVSEYLQANDSFKSGYVFGVMESLTLVSSGEDDKHSVQMLRCMLENKINSTEGVRIIEQYIVQTPQATATQMIAVALRAFNQVCEKYLN